MQEQAQLQKTTEAIEARAAEVKMELKREMMTSWIQSGGSLEDFDKIFEEQLYPQEMARRTLSKGPEQQAVEEARRNMQRIIVDGFKRV